MRNTLLRTSCVFALVLFATALTAPVFEVTLPPDLDFTLENSPTPQKYLIKTMPGGVALLDYNNDGLLDIFLVNGDRVSKSMSTHGNFDRHDPPETLYSLGKAASLEGAAAAAETAWTKLLSIEKQSALAALAHFGLTGLHRKQGKTAEAQRENAGIPETAEREPDATIWTGNTALMRLWST